MENIPLDLQDLPIWYLRTSRKVRRPDSDQEIEDRVSPKGLTRILYPSPLEFSDYSKAVTILREHPLVFSGMGIYLPDELNVIVLENAVTTEGAIASWASPWISSFRSYWQFTPDKRSVQCVFRSQRSYGSARFKLGAEYFTVWERGSFCEMSDSPIEESEDLLGWCDAALGEILEQSSGRAEPGDGGAERSDETTLLAVQIRDSQSEGSENEDNSANAERQSTSQELDRRSIVINGRQHRDVVTDINESVQAANDPAVLFAYYGRLSEIRDQQDGSCEIVPVTPATLVMYMSLAADFYRVRANGDMVASFPPSELNQGFLEIPADKLGYPRLRGVINTPTHRADGTVIATPGYDSKSQLYFRPQSRVEGIEIPDHPSRDEVARARERLADLVVDFRFAEESDRANFFAALMTPALRPTIDGNIPMFCVKAPRPDSGKSTLCNTLGYVYRGASLANTSAPKPNSLEWEKKLFAMARTGPTFVLFDNVEHEVESDFLAQALTAPTSQSRILGQSQTQLVFNRSMFIANGNAEFSVGLNIKRRCFWSNLESHDAPLGRKADETPWIHSPFDQFVKRNRCELLQAILTLTRAWFAAGCPAPKTPTIDSFEEWSRIVGGVLEHAEIPDFLANYDKMVLEGDSADAEWEIFLQAARWTLGFETLTTKDFVLRVQWADAAKEMLPEDLQESFRKGNIHAIGKVFYKRCGIPYGETRIKLVRVGPNRDKVMTWRIELPPV